MNYLIFCTFEVGGLPFQMADILNRNGIKTYYISLDRNSSDHDSTLFHFGNRAEDWDLSNMFRDLTSTSEIVARLRSVCKNYNISHCLATGTGAYLLHKAGVNYQYWCFGADLDQLCFHRVFPLGYPLWKKCVISLLCFLKERPKARESIRKAQSVMIALYQIEALNKISPSKKLFFLPHYFKITDYDELLSKKNENKDNICREIKAKRFFFSSVRHVWSGYLKDETDNKGNDVVIGSFKKYLEITNDFDSKLVLVEKGPDVEGSKSLIRQLGIAKHIVWIKEIRRDELNAFYQGATLCFGQFGTSAISFAVLEPLANATICISYYGTSHPSIPFYRDFPPILNSKNAEEIARFMFSFVNDKIYYENMCYRSWQWIRDNCSEQKFVELFVKSFD